MGEKSKLLQTQQNHPLKRNYYKCNQ